MRTIGLLGGMSWQSSALYYRYANELVAERLGGVHSARVVLVSVDFAEVEQMQHEDRWDDAATLLADAARRCRAAGADLLLLCTNTMHLVAEQVQSAVDIPLLHLADVTAAAVVGAGVRQVGLLGTASTMDRPFYRERLEAAGLTVLVPGADERAEVNRVIFEELCVGTFTPAARTTFQQIIRGLVQRGAEGVVLGCTEIELLVRAEDSTVPLFPTTQIHVRAAVDLALQIDT